MKLFGVSKCFEKKREKKNKVNLVLTVVLVLKSIRFYITLLTSAPVI